MAGPNHRKADAADRAADAGGRATSPDEIAAAFYRAADDLALLSPLRDEAEEDAPSLEEPWDPTAAAALVQLYESGDAGLARPLASDAELQLRLASIVTQAAALHPQSGPRASAGTHIEARLAELAGRIEAALTEGPASSDAGGLRIIEAHVGELLDRVQDARTELDRIAAIEMGLGEVRASLADSRIAGLLESALPTQDELTRFAETAAQKAIRGRADTVGDRSATARLSERAGEIQRSLTKFIEEHRQGERHTAEALDTIQEAIQHILDRLDAIEGAQAATGQASSEDSQQPWSEIERPGQTPAVGSVEDARARAGLAAPTLSHWYGPQAGTDEFRSTFDDRSLEASGCEDMSLADRKFDASALQASSPDAADIAAAKARLKAEKTDYEARPRPFAALGPRTASPAEPRERHPALRSGVLLAASLAAFLLAGYWLVSGPKLQTPDDIGAQTAEQRSEPDQGAPALRSFSVAPGDGATQPFLGRPLAGAPDQAIEHKSPASRAGPGEQPETQAQHSKGDAETASVQGPVGVVIEQGSTALSPEELLRLRQRQRMANLSTRLGQQAADTTAQPVVIRADVGAGSGEVIRTAATSAARASLELPPIMIGPHSLRHAAASGDPSAQFEVAARFAEGKGVTKDFEQAAVWYQRAATQGFAAAQYRLAALYERGIGVKADLARARTWYQRAAEQGNLKAMHNLAVLAARSTDGGKPDYAAAARWFGKAAAHGLADSQYNLALLHENGLGVEKDAIAAYKWYALAARTGDKEAVRRRNLVKERLGAVALAEADLEIEAWAAMPADRLANDARAAGQAWKRRAQAGAEE